jgi:cytosine/uracil/thiamine/allantoin permease
MIKKVRLKKLEVKKSNIEKEEKFEKIVYDNYGWLLYMFMCFIIFLNESVTYFYWEEHHVSAFAFVVSVINFLVFLLMIMLIVDSLEKREVYYRRVKNEGL